MMEDFTALINGLHGYSVALGLAVGLVCGFLFAMLIYRSNSRNIRRTFESLSDEMKNTFDNLSSEALNNNHERFLNLANDKFADQTERHSSELEGKKEQIALRLGEMDAKLGKVEKLVSEFEKARESKLGALDDQLKQLSSTTASLQKALADNQTRGRWGERIAQQILEYLGLREGISYEVQRKTPSGARPDFTFKLPNQLLLNMDCKFPLDNYMAYVDAETNQQREKYSKSFLRNVEKHVADVSKRDYINKQTVNCVLVFIPNEQVFRFIHEESATIFDNALRNKIVLCSPLTLYIVLAIVRQAAETFMLEQRSREIIEVIHDIRHEWDKYAAHMDGMGKNFGTLERKFRELTGERTSKLDRRFDRIDNILESGSDSTTQNQAESSNSREWPP